VAIKELFEKVKMSNYVTVSKDGDSYTVDFSHCRSSIFFNKLDFLMLYIKSEIDKNKLLEHNKSCEISLKNYMPIKLICKLTKK